MTFDDGYTSVWLDSLVGLPAARSVFAASVPVPERATVVGLLAWLPASVSVLVRVPDTVGRKVTETVQLALAARALPQVLVCAKSPPAVIPVNEALPVPELVTVTVCAALVVFTVWSAKASDPGDAVRVAVGVPLLAVRER